MRSVHAVIALSLAQGVICWGELGHGTVAYIAQKYLTPESASYLNQILVDGQGNQVDFFDAAIWPDQVRPSRPYTEGWHFIDAQDSPPDACQVSYPQDCTNSEHKNGCVIDAITNQTSLFLDQSQDPTVRFEALKYIMHFVGDLHQPLHVENAYRGGNEIEPVCFAHACAKNNLHAVWDKDIPYKITGTKNSAHHDDLIGSAHTWADKLYSANTGLDADPLACTNVAESSECTLPWAREANSYVCSVAMKESVEWYKSNDLSLDYYDAAAPVVEYLIGRAGERLGAYLNALVQAAQGGESGGEDTRLEL